MAILKMCAGCLKEHDSSLRFDRGSPVCHYCAVLAPIDLICTVHEALISRGASAPHPQSTLAKRLTRLQARYAVLQVSGKRCSSCRARKPVADFDRSMARGDGLQPECRSCQHTRGKLYRAGLRYQWPAVREALRALACKLPELPLTAELSSQVTRYRRKFRHGNCLIASA